MVYSRTAHIRTEWICCLLSAVDDASESRRSTFSSSSLSSLQRLSSFFEQLGEFFEYLDTFQPRLGQQVSHETEVITVYEDMEQVGMEINLAAVFVSGYGSVETLYGCATLSSSEVPSWTYFGSEHKDLPGQLLASRSFSLPTEIRRIVLNGKSNPFDG